MSPPPAGLASLGLPSGLIDPLRGALEAGEGLFVVSVPAGDDAGDTVAVLLAELAALGHVPATVDAAKGAGALEAALDGGAEALAIPHLSGAGVAVLAVRAAATGRLVVAGLEADDIAGALARLLELHADPVLLASAFRFGLQRRRLRRVCPDCLKRVPADPALLEDLRLDRALAGELLPRAAGCPDCRGTGYRGSLDVYEGLGPDDRLAAAVAAAASEGLLRGVAVPARSLAAEALSRLKSGQTTLEELRKQIPYLQLIRAADV